MRLRFATTGRGVNVVAVPGARRFIRHMKINSPSSATVGLHRMTSLFAWPARGLLLVGLAFALVGCGPKKGALDGTYASKVQSYTFAGDKVSATVMGRKIGNDWPYSVEGNKVILKGPGGELMLIKNDDGSLSDPAQDKLVKQ